ncbi:MAG: J domain-containing protein [Anaerolineae bacterium]|nr:J domain-containing protein [Anaerolineae bacterium]MDW8069981.1 J domain-containing protein [Anaerolineae bacterium]
MNVRDPYQVLGLEPGASLEEVRQAYFEQVRAHPPERDPEIFKMIRAAYEQLNRPTETPDPLFQLREPATWSPEQVDVETRVNTCFHREDVLTALRAWSDLEREDFSSDWREVDL